MSLRDDIQGGAYGHDPGNPMIPTARVRGRGALVAGVLIAIAVTLATPAAVRAAPDHALASAAYGQAEAWWQRTPGDRSHRQLVFRASRHAIPRVLALPPNRRYTTDLALSVDADDALAVVIKDRSGLVWTRARGRIRLRRVPGSTRADSRPSLLRGRIAYLRRGDNARSMVRLGSLIGPARRIWTSRDSSFVPWDLALGAGHAVVLVTYLEGAEAASYQAHLIRPGQPSKPLAPTVELSHDRVSDMRIAHVSPSGRRLTVEQRVDATTTRLVYALPSGRRFSHVATAFDKS